MANPTIKSTAIVRAGYEFQDLVGIETLIRFYRAPELFDWVALEADDDEYGSLDDVVAARSDGTFEFVQVKFTVGGGEYLLDWNWLLSRKAHGTSLLNKWTKSFLRVRDLGPIHSACLRTNRPPSPAFEAAMNGALLSLDLLDGTTRQLVETECGGPDAAADFFAQFEFQTIDETLSGLEARIRLELVPSDILPSGWHYFRDEVRRWAMLRNEPPGGRILYRHLAQVITRNRPEPIRQDFQIPPGYSLPSQQFHDDFRARIADPSTPITVLWGTPGRGKSTYLSYLAEKLREEHKPILRHHYFLSGDDTADRISYAEISHSLISQLLLRHPEAVPSVDEEVDKLRHTLALAANHFEQLGERFYIIVDGLDHVWRDYRKVDQLNFLFNKLLPLPSNVSLIVGTQRVPNDQLPNRLLAHAGDDDWVAIPPMDEFAVHTWIEMQDKASRLILKEERGDERQSVITAVSGAFFKVSSGHPLHLIYAFESLVRSGASIDAEDVLLIPPCPDGDIRAYYGNLWNALGDTGRQILHALAGSEFYWPSLGIRQCLGSYDEIAFLLEPRASGIHPFHGSILAFVRERQDHSEAFLAVLPRIVEWLENQAPPYWRWGWLWLSRAKLGNYQPLMDGISRSWAIASLAQGWSERQIIHIFQVAEEHAFAGLNLPRAVELRSTKTRVMNAREYQIQDFAGFEEAAIASSKNWQQLDNMLDNAAGLSDREIAMLPRAAPRDRRDEVAELCEEELGRRIDVWLELRHRPDGEFVTLAHLYFDVVALSRFPDIAGVWDFLIRFKEPASHINYFTDRLSKSTRYEALIQLWDKVSDEKWRYARERIEEHILRVACRIGADPFARIDLSHNRLTPLFAVWSRLHRPNTAISVELPPVPANMVRERYEYGIDHGLRDFAYALFFAELSHALSENRDVPFDYPGLATAGLGWLGKAFDLIREVARQVACGDVAMDLAAPFQGAEELEPVFHGRNRATESDQAQYRSFVAALRMIAPDLHLVGARAAPGTMVGAEVLAKARSSSHWNDEAWLQEASDHGHAIMTTEAADQLISAVTATLAGTVTEFIERAESWTLRSRVAAIYDLPVAQELAARASDCLLGYGYRKDPWIFDILDAVSTVHDVELSPAMGWLTSLVPVVDKITDFTDGAGTNHAPSELIETIAETYPERLGSLFLHYVEEEEWRQADDCLLQFAKVWPLDSPESSAAIGTFLDPKVLGGLRDRAKGGDAGATTLLDRQLAFLGGMPTNHSDHYRSSSSEIDERKPKIEIRGHDDFKGVVADAEGAITHQDLVAHYRGWLKLHKEAGKGKLALDAIRTYFETGEPTYKAEGALDAAFEVSMEVEGRDAAYHWLVKAHIARHGWQSNWTSREEILTRLQLAANHYPERWKQFIHDTAEPQEFWKKRGYGLTIGTKYLVHFLIMVGQRDLAKGVVDAMVASIVDEVHDQPIPEAPWFR